MGGEASTNLYGMAIAQLANDIPTAKVYYDKVCDFIQYCIDTFGKEDFYIECAPSTKNDQVIVNKKLVGLAKAYGLNITEPE
jgi:DNA polymerase-3 subunit alpha